jgi:hypothetical protein
MNTPHNNSWWWASMALAALSAAGSLTASGCRYDPVPQNLIDDLPAEDPDGPSELHRQGQPCVLCHSDYEGAEPALAIGGTVFEQNTVTFQLIPVEGVFVTVFDSAGASQKACTNAAGNFFVRAEDWPDAKFPMTVQVGNRSMRSLIGRERSCASCHQLATVERVENDPTVNSSTGAGRDSAGAILVERAQVPDEEKCGPNPAGSTGAGGMMTSGAGGDMGSGGTGGGS